MQKIKFILLFCLFHIVSYSQFDCASPVVITNGYTATGITTPGNGGIEDWNTNPTAACGTNTSYWDDDVYLFSYTTGANDETITMDVNSFNSWNGVGIFSTCTGTTFSGCLDAVGTTGVAAKQVSAVVSSNTTVYIAVGQWGSPDDLNFDVTSFTAVPLTTPPNCDASLTTPLNAATGVSEEVDLVWSAATGSPTGYKLTMGTTPGGTDVLNAVDVGNVTTYDVGILNFSTTYYVTIVPYNGNGDATGCIEESFTTRATPPAGEVCANPIVVGTLPFNTSDDTATYLDDYSGSPGGSCGTTSGYLNGDDVVYSYTPAANEIINIDITGISANYAGVFVYDDCVNIGTTCYSNGAFNSNVTSDLSINGLSVTGGTTYYIVISTWAAPQSVAYTMDITAPSCPDPTALTVSNITATSADLAWTEIGTATAWDIEIVDITAGGAPTGTPTADDITNPYIATGLTPANSYDYYVRSDCGMDNVNVSAWVGPFNFATACNTFTAPYKESFATNSLPLCWAEGGVTTWEYGSLSGTTPSGFADYGANTLADNTPGGGGTFIGMDGSDNTDGEVSTLTTPFVDVSGLTTPELSYFVFSNNINDAAQNQLLVEFWDGATWNTVNTVQANLGSNWVEYTTDLSAFTISGDVQSRFTVTGVANGGFTFYNDILLDDICFRELVLCIAPSALTASNITTTTADLAWTENGTATAWDIEIVDITAGGTPTGTVTANDVTNPHTITGLTPDNDYEYYVRADCAMDDTDVSTWVGPFAFRTAPTCPPPTALTITGISASTADLTWTAGGTETAWDIEVVDITAGGTPTGTPTFNDVTTNAPYQVTGLTGNNDYEFYVRADCAMDDTDVSTWISVTATTLCSPEAMTCGMDYLQDFSASPECSFVANGPVTGPNAAATNPWYLQDFANAGGGDALVFNAYDDSFGGGTGNTFESWFLSPEFDLSAGGPYEMTMDIALNNYNSIAAGTFGSDDQVQLLITNDAGATWTNLETWDNTSVVSATGEPKIYDLTSYAGQTIQFGFWGTTGTVDDTEDVEFHVDNFRVGCAVTTNPCVDGYETGGGNQLTGMLDMNADYETDQGIDSDQMIGLTTPAIGVDYDAAIDIDLLPGFEVALGVEFDAFIDGCQGGTDSGAGGNQVTGSNPVQFLQTTDNELILDNRTRSGKLNFIPQKISTSSNR